MTINTWPGASFLRGWLGLARFAGLTILSGCSVLDPDGDWRGRPLSHPVIVEAPPSAPPAAARVESVGSPRPMPLSAAPAAAEPERSVNLELLLAQLEQSYAAGRFEEASARAAEILKWWPDEPRAWLREANLRHREGDLQLALQAYRRVLDLTAQRHAADTPERAGLRARAHANLAIVGVEQARQAIDALDASRDDPATAAHRARIETALRAVVAGGPTVPAGSTPALHPNTDRHQATPSHSHGPELIRGGLVR